MSLANIKTGSGITISDWIFDQFFTDSFFNNNIIKLSLINASYIGDYIERNSMTVIVRHHRCINLNYHKILIRVTFCTSDVGHFNCF